MKNTVKNQSGRSMVEMLAVLAIMGVLSVTGIMAYNYAMIKHQANELIHKANLAYMDVLSHDSLKNWSDLKITGINNASLKGVIYKDVGYVLAENIDEDVCNQILNDKTNFSLMTISNIEFTSCELTNDIVFDFANGKDIGTKCISGHCPEEANGQYCSTNTGTCVMQTNCESDLLWSFDTDACDTCENINGNVAPVFTQNGCISCEEDDNTKPFWDKTTKKCVNCLNDTDCEVNSYCDNNTCTACPENSSVDVTSNGQITGTNCYCNSGYKLNNNNICITELEYKCTDGFIVTGKVTKQQYCVSNDPILGYENTNNWCTDRQMNLLEKDVLCPNNPAVKTVCDNLKEVTSGYAIAALTKTPYVEKYHYTVLLSSGYSYYHTVLQRTYTSESGWILTNNNNGTIDKAYAICQ